MRQIRNRRLLPPETGTYTRRSRDERIYWLDWANQKWCWKRATQQRRRRWSLELEATSRRHRLYHCGGATRAKLPLSWVASINLNQICTFLTELTLRALINLNVGQINRIVQCRRKTRIIAKHFLCSGLISYHVNDKAKQVKTSWCWDV